MAVSSLSPASPFLRFRAIGHYSLWQSHSLAMDRAMAKLSGGWRPPDTFLVRDLSRDSVTESRRKFLSCMSCKVPHVDAVESHPTTGLKIGIVGFENFGKFIAPAFAKHGHTVLATSRSDYSDHCWDHGIQFFRSIDALCEEQPDIILICTSIISTESVVRSIPIQLLKPGTIFADVLSVKQFPRNLFLEVLPEEFGLVCTHPMFGPESGKHGWVGLPFVYDKVRIAKDGVQSHKCREFLRVFEQEGCRMMEMACEEHDRHAAGSQFITHTIGRILSHLDLESTPINTKGYESLLQLTENTVSDSFDLYYGLFMYNINAREQLDNLDRAFDTVKQKLFGRLHDILRKQIVEPVPAPAVTNSGKRVVRLDSSYFLPKAQDVKDLSSFSVASEENDEHAGFEKPAQLEHASDSLRA